MRTIKLFLFLLIFLLIQFSLAFYFFPYEYLSFLINTHGYLSGTWEVWKYIRHLLTWFVYGIRKGPQQSYFLLLSSFVGLHYMIKHLCHKIVYYRLRASGASQSQLNFSLKERWYRFLYDTYGTKYNMETIFEHDLIVLNFYANIFLVWVFIMFLNILYLHSIYWTNLILLLFCFALEILYKRAFSKYRNSKWYYYH